MPGGLSMIQYATQYFLITNVEVNASGLVVPRQTVVVVV